MKIAMLGAGAFGTALGGLLADNGYDVDYYDRFKEKEALSGVLEGARIITLCVPSGVSSHLLPYLPKNIPLVIATKGFLSDKIFSDFKEYMVISGPGFAEDIKAGKETTMTVTNDKLKELFKADFMHFDQTNDVKGVLMCGALKNIYAIGAGLESLRRDSLEWKEYISAVSEEMKVILTLNGAKASTVDLACGIGDLELTCGLPSRNYEYGNLLRRNPEYKPEKTIEGLDALKRVIRGDIEVPDSALVLLNLMKGFAWL